MFGFVDEDSDDNKDPDCFEKTIPSYLLFVLLYLTKARSSFWSETAVNCATTIDLKPVAFLPSACIPCIPNTDLKEVLKIYGDAPVTVSVSTNTCAFALLKPPAEPAGKLGLTNGNEYWNLVASITFDTFVDIL